MGFKFNPLLFSGFDIAGSSAGGAATWKSTVATEATLPTVGNTDGDVRVTLDSDYIWEWDATTSRWINTGFKSAAVGTTPNASGYAITDVNVGANRTERRLELEPADGTNPGVVTAGTQTLGGNKTLTGSLTVNGQANLNELQISDAGSVTLINSPTQNIEIRSNGGAGQLVLNAVTLLQADATASLGAVTLQQLQAAIQGVDVKEGVLVSTTANITLSGEQTIDGSLTSNSRVLVRFQTTPSQNGIYVSSAGAWTRATDADSASKLNNAFVSVSTGTLYANTGWYQFQEVVTLNTDPVNFNQFFGAGTYTADGLGIELVGSTFSLELDGTTLSKSASGVRVATAGITNNEVATGIDAVKIANGTVSNTEFQYLDGVTSPLQTQLGGKATTELDNLTTTAVNADLNMNAGKTIRVKNNNAFISRNAADTTDVPLIYLDAFNRTTLNNTAGSNILTNNNIIGAANQSYSLGVTGDAWTNVYSAVFNIYNGADRGEINATSATPSGGSAANGGVGLVVTDIARNAFLFTASGTATKSVFVESGNASAGSSGDIVSQTGTATGTRGKLKFKDGTEGTIGHVWTESATDGTGSWQAPAPTESSFSLANNQASAANVTGLLFSAGTRSALVHYSIFIDATSDLYECGQINVLQRGADWVFSQDATGDLSLVSFSITTGGQMQYTSANYSGFVSATMKFRVVATTTV